jgi:hypothetical protein
MLTVSMKKVTFLKGCVNPKLDGFTEVRSQELWTHMTFWGPIGKREVVHQQPLVASPTFHLERARELSAGPPSFTGGTDYKGPPCRGGGGRSLKGTAVRDFLLTFISCINSTWAQISRPTGF